MKKVLFVTSLFFTQYLLAQDLNIIPAPVSYKMGSGSFQLTPKTTIVIKDDAEVNTAAFLNDYLSKFYHLTLPVVKAKSPASNYILLSTKQFIKAPDNEGRYTMNVTGNSINIEGDTYQGTFYGMQTLLQLLPPIQNNSNEENKGGNAKVTSRITSRSTVTQAANTYSLPAVSIEDFPRFQYRGMLLDVGRHFFSVDFVKKFIDFIALHKMNTFHWHLTEDQGWRIEIKKYPRLTSVGAYRNGTVIGRYLNKGNDSIRYGGYYTQDEIKDVVKYAADRFITIIPEIEMPGHSSAAIAAYPELSCFPTESTKVAPQVPWSGSRQGKQVQQSWGVFEDVYCPSEYTFNFLENVLDEVMQLFPSQYIHIGGDESPKESWKRSEFCQQLIKEKGLKDEHGLQSYFIQRIEKYLNSKGRKIIGWDEILEGGLAPNATVMSWRGEQGGVEAAKQKHNVIMTPGAYVYLDHAERKNEDSVVIGGFTSLEKIYSYQPIPKELTGADTSYVLGSQGNVWTEYIGYPSKVEYMIFPRMSALSEVLWSPNATRNYKDFERRLPVQFARYNMWNVNYSTAYFDIESTISPTFTNNGLMVTLTSKSKAPIYITYKKTNAGMKYTGPLFINGSADVEAQIIENGKVLTTLDQDFSINKATGKNVKLATPPSTNYPGNGGSFGLVNGLKAKQLNSSEWLGWLTKDMDAVIDLTKTDNISKITVNAWKQEQTYIYLPTAIDVYTSTDNINWKQLNETSGQWKDDRSFTIDLGKEVPARYVRIVAHNTATVPEGKPGAGRATYVLVDEIEIE